MIGVSGKRGSTVKVGKKVYVCIEMVTSEIRE